jgi:dTMP kinase
VFVAFEGGEASGKSTQARLLAERLDALLTREPGGTPLGEAIRAVLLDHATGELDGRTEALLLAAARAHHVVDVIRPALDAGRAVVTDRFTGSSLAYQGYGRGVALDELRHLNTWATGGLDPDLTILLEVDPEAAAARRGRPPDRLESAGDDFHRRVAEGYRAMAAADPIRWAVIDGTRPVDDVHDEVWHVVQDRSRGA